jgi:hypothetical protein
LGTVFIAHHGSPARNELILKILSKVFNFEQIA